MEFRTLDVTLISCENLTCGYTNRPIKKNAMGIIRLPRSNQVYSSTLDKDNGAYPHWNEKFRVQIPIGAGWFDVEIRRGMESVIGFARVPVSDFVSSIVPAGFLNCLSYRLRRRNGEFGDGIVNISVRVVVKYETRTDCGGGEIRGVVEEVAGGKVEEDGGCGSWPGYGPYGYGYGGVVTGVPVCYGTRK